MVCVANDQEVISTALYLRRWPIIWFPNGFNMALWCDWSTLYGLLSSPDVFLLSAANHPPGDRSSLCQPDVNPPLNATLGWWKAFKLSGMTPWGACFTFMGLLHLICSLLVLSFVNVVEKWALIQDWVWLALYGVSWCGVDVNLFYVHCNILHICSGSPSKRRGFRWIFFSLSMFQPNSESWTLNRPYPGDTYGQYIN